MYLYNTKQADFAEARNLDMSSAFTEATAACVEVDKSNVNRIEKHRLWDEISKLLTQHSTEKVQWKFHVCVMEESLRLGTVPPSKVITQLSYNRPDMCLRAFIADGADFSLEAAASLATQYLHWSNSGCVSDEFASGRVVPVSLLDFATETFKQRLAVGGLSDNVVIKLKEYLSSWSQ